MNKRLYNLNLRITLFVNDFILNHKRQVEERVKDVMAARGNDNNLTINIMKDSLNRFKIILIFIPLNPINTCIKM
ncbi:hypothetical protein GCM10011346_40450 [Oceanobacillus neutriphilus]|uniref:Uncharacterized protein n=1 Tax=Oceanobacillus neutriphilus TaxID=531815 RepID=A0ABQ2P058_9BACI|nr:hypothetical protein GCM10011346_40450 [Oceanobacillus neutriphilus]